MKRPLVAVATALALTFSSGASAAVPIVLIPSPISVVVSAGVWILQNTERVYYIKVEGAGANFNEAKDAGLRLAVERAIGSVVASESSSENGRLTKDEIISYSSGYVTKYEVDSTKVEDSVYKVQLQVWVGKSPVANRLLGESKKDAEIDGDQASAQIASIKQERKSGAKLVANVLADYPKRAFKLEVGKTGVSLDVYGNTNIQVPYTVKWDKDFLLALDSALRVTSQQKDVSFCWMNCNIAASITVATGEWFSSSGGNYSFTELTTFRYVSSSLWSARPAVLIRLINDRNQTVFSACQYHAELDGQSGNIVPSSSFLNSANSTQLTINGTKKLSSVASFSVQADQAESLSRVVASIVRSDQCPNQ